MIDMKMPPPSSSMLTGSDDVEQPAYPYGLRIRLDQDTLKALAIGESTMPQVGQRMLMHAMVEVVSVSKDAGETEEDRSVELQITTMELLPPDQPNEQQLAAKRIAGMYETTLG